MGHIDDTRGKIESQISQSFIPLNSCASPFKPARISHSPRRGYRTLESHISSTRLRRWKHPYPRPITEQDLRHFGTQRHKNSVAKSILPTRANLGPLKATPINYSAFAQIHSRGLRRHRSCESNSVSPMASKCPPNPQRSMGSIQSISPAKRPRSPSRVGQRPVKYAEELTRHDLEEGLAEITYGDLDVGVASSTQNEKPSTKRRCTVSGTSFPMKGKGALVRSISPYRRHTIIRRHTVLSSRQNSGPKLSEARRCETAHMKGLEDGQSYMGNNRGCGLHLEEWEVRDPDSIVEATSEPVNTVPMSEVLKALGDIQEMAEGYVELLGSHSAKLPGGRSREEIVSEIERCRDDAFNQLLGRWPDRNPAERYAALLRRGEPLHKTSSPVSWDRVSEVVQRFKDCKSLAKAPMFPVSAGIRHHGNGGSAGRGRAVVDKGTDGDPMPGAFPADTAFQKENKRNGSDSGSDNEKRASRGTLRPKHYAGESDESTSEEMSEGRLSKGKGRATGGDEEVFVALSVNNASSAADSRGAVGYDEEDQGDSEGYESGCESQELSQNEAAAHEWAFRYGEPGLTLDTGVSLVESDRFHPLHRRPSKSPVKRRNEGGCPKSRPLRPGGILKKGDRKSGESPKRVKNVGRRNTQTETEVATISYIPDSAPAVSRLLGIPVNQSLKNIEIDIPSPSPGTQKPPLGKVPGEDVKTVNCLSGESSSRPPRQLDDIRKAEIRVKKAAVKIRKQANEVEEGASHSTIKARVRGVRNAKGVGCSANPGEDEDPGLFNSDLDEMNSDDAATRILPSLTKGRPRERRFPPPQATAEDSSWESDDGDGIDGGVLQRVRSLITPFESDDEGEEPSRVSRNASNLGGLITGLGVVDTHQPRSMTTQQGSSSPGGAPSTWTDHRHARQSKPASPVATARRGLSAMFRAPTQSRSKASDRSGNGKLGTRMKKLLSKPQATEPLMPQSPAETPLASSSRTAFVESATSGSAQTSSRTPAEASSATPDTESASQTLPQPTHATPTTSIVSFRTAGSCAPQCTWKHVEESRGPPPPIPRERDPVSN
ncbi:hypothetical protein FGG08_000890 [Glutinoglossum americanum]|uniref:Uncharacterized protein n=1 Tax=Glutinoglossum americanum TaxID=1670608 RepID=A0A9P8L5S2_9PEZI|nr:hypothetical protein FGG08_000890 [Glutinoglossum americanum]